MITSMLLNLEDIANHSKVIPTEESNLMRERANFQLRQSTKA